MFPVERGLGSPLGRRQAGKRMGGERVETGRKGLQAEEQSRPRLRAGRTWGPGTHGGCSGCHPPWALSLELTCPVPYRDTAVRPAHGEALLWAVGASGSLQGLALSAD